MNGEDSRGISTDPVKGGMSKGNLPGVAHEHIEAQRQQGVDSDEGQELQMIGIVGGQANEHNRCQKDYMPDVLHRTDH